MAQDIAKGRRTEIEFMNGFIVEQGLRVGRAAPAHQALVEAVKQVERGELTPSPDVIRDLLPA
jgi:2-dehydropantoate 2-reductase